MKILKTVIIAICLTGICYAGTSINPKDLPEPVTKTLKAYFPGSAVLSAKKDTDDGKQKYEVKIQYKAITLEIELTPEGKIVDAEMND